VWQRATVTVLTVIVAATRLLAISRAPWEWDEILFAAAVRDYDVVVHHPHPPGFPLYIALAKVVTLLGASEFQALEVVVVAGAMLLFPLTYALGRTLDFGFWTSIGGGLLVAFAPNAWYYGGTAFTDVPGLALILGASVLLLRGSYLWGCVLFGIALGFRPQLALVAAVPFAIATWRGFDLRPGSFWILDFGFWIARHPNPKSKIQNPKLTWLGVALLASIVIASYGGAAIASSSASEYVDVVRKQQDYVARVDSFLSPTRPSLLSLTRTFFKPTRGSGALDKIIPVLAFLGLVAAMLRRKHWLLLAMFGPIAVFSWLMLDVNAASRYVIGYLPMFGLFAALGIATIVRSEGTAASLCALVAIIFAINAWPVLRQVREELPPIQQAIRSIDRGTVFTTAGVVPFAEFYGRDVVDLSERPDPKEGYLLMDSLSSEPCAMNFMRAHGKLADIARARYFEASVVPAKGCGDF
jgi:hypothetical protein